MESDKYSEELLYYMKDFILEERYERILEVSSMRTKYITVVLEDLFQPHNASAVLRSCECFGIQDLYVIEGKNSFEPNHEIHMGSSKWVDVHVEEKNESSTLNAISKLKKSGYRIVATSSSIAAKPLDELNLSAGKIALLFGTELTGLSQVALDNADELIHIPMNGFTESLNISVATAICLQKIRSDLENSDISWPLTDQELINLRLTWVKQTVKTPSMLEKRFRENRRESV